MSEAGYEISDPITLGGASGQYTYRSPWNTECEWAIISAVGLGAFASTASFVIGAKNSKQPTLSATGADSFGSILTSSPDSNNGLPAYVGALTSNAPFVTYSGDAYMPLPAPADIYLTTNTPAQTEVLVTIQFRRSLDHVIPETPRARPSTHSQPLPRKGSRTFVEGFAARSDLASEPYHHQPLSAQETGETVGRFGKLAPTNIKHRGVAKNGR